MTTHFLKRCIKIPKPPKDKTITLPNIEKVKHDPFKRGIMRFEDYNYNMYNKYILIDN